MNVDFDRFVVLLTASTLLWGVVSLVGMLGLLRARASFRRLGGLVLFAGFVVVAGLAGWHSRVRQESNSQPAAPSVRIIQPPVLATEAAEPFVESVGPWPATADSPMAGIVWRLPSDWRDSVRLFGWVWLCGASGLMMACLLEMLWLFRIRRTGRRILPQNERLVVESTLCRGPFCAGLFRPCIILPQGLANHMDPQVLAGLLAHEEAHIRHGDIWLAHLEAVVCALMWWNPLVWVLARWLSRACEEVCDQVVVGGGANRERYAECLVKAARHASRATWRLAPGASSDFSRLKKRVELILHAEATQQPSWWRRWTLGTPVLVLAIWIGVSAASIGFGEETVSPQSPDEGFGRTVEVPPATLPAAYATAAALDVAVEGLEATATASEVKIPAMGPLVILDPGHGGYDSGERVRNVSEKDVVLELSHQVSEALKQSGLRVEMTRTDDTTLTLAERLALANKLQPSFFLSIHSDRGARFGGSHGLSVVEATNTGLGTAFATALAGAANEAVVAVATRTFKLAREPACPALVFEAGGLSNSQDLARLTDEKKRELLAKAVAHAVLSVMPGGQMAARTAPEPRVSPAVVHSETVHYPSPLDKNPSVLADGFDFPVGAPDAEGYYVFRPHSKDDSGHIGEDWNGKRGGNTDLGDPVFSVANGLVVLSAEIGNSHGNVIIVRHRYLEKDGSEQVCDSLYAHLLDRHVSVGAEVRRGQQIGGIGTANGTYAAHLHFEMRKNPAIGMNRSRFARDTSNYWTPRDFIQSYRPAR